jgi:hypothetical protein
MSPAYAVAPRAIENYTAPANVLWTGRAVKCAKNSLLFNTWPDQPMSAQGVSYVVMIPSHEQSGVDSTSGYQLTPYQWFDKYGTRALADPPENRPLELVPADTFPLGIEITTVRTGTRAIEARFKVAFQRARSEYFEDGMDSQFTTDLGELVKSRPADAKEILMRLLDDNVASPRVWAEAMRWFGEANDLLSRPDAIALLKKGLFSPYPEVRDGAILGFANLDVPESISLLTQARFSEARADLRADIDQVLEQLKRS